MDNLQMIEGLKTAFIDEKIPSNIIYKPQFLYNDSKKGIKVLSTIKNELTTCEEFIFSVAFITMSGIAPLLGILEELHCRGVKGKILTTNYLNFTEPKALRKLAEYPNLEVKMYQGGSQGFHTKGYIFKQREVYKFIVGSSNMTGAALTSNKEWNSVLVSTGSGEYALRLLGEFEELWNSTKSIKFDDFIEIYSEVYYENRKKREEIENQSERYIKQEKLSPNLMQREFISKLEILMEKGEKRALLLSATGTGKTYAAAFAMRKINPNRVLFVVHREGIARRAMKSFQNVITESKTCGIVSGNQKDYQADYVFATINTMTKTEVLNKYAPNEFDVIIIDEAHHAAAKSFQNIIDYFEPQLLLGMTATPERMDDYDIYGLFHHNIAFEIRLQQAMEEDMLTPFHYFGITDILFENQDNDVDLTDFNNLVANDRIEYIIEKIRYYGYSGDRVKGLIFCSRKDEANELSNEFNRRGYRTKVLTGENSQIEREKCIERLVQKEEESALDYIFSVDIFNEGIDIPEINQVVMLRPTESPNVFIQQLGRGLRKDKNKEYVVILDFIGNYSNNFMIPIALSGDRSYNKDNIRRYVMEGERIIPGGSTIYFDEIAKEKIFKSITEFGVKLKFLKEKYFQMKNKIGEIPTMMDFVKYGELDPMLFVNYARSYYNFVRKVDPDYKISFAKEQINVLEFISSYAIDGKRVHELVLLKEMLNNDTVEIQQLLKCSKEAVKIREVDLVSGINVLNKNFINAPGDKVRYENMEIIDDQKSNDNIIKRAQKYTDMLLDSKFNTEVYNLIEYGMYKNKHTYDNTNEDNLVLYEKYSRKDVCRILNWQKDDSATMYGYRIKYNTCPLFVTYNKKEDISESTKYEDKFIDNRLFSWMSRSNVKKTSIEAQKIIEYKSNALKLHLFVKESDAEGSDFYYLGQVIPIDWEETITHNNAGKELPIMNFVMQLDVPVRDDLYEYFTGINTL